MNIQEVFAKVSSVVGSQTKSVNSAMHQLDKHQSANCRVHTGLILNSQDSSNSKIIAPPLSQHQFINTAASVSETWNHSWFVKSKREELSEYFKFHPYQPETIKFKSKNVYFGLDDAGGRLQRLWLSYCEEKEALFAMFALQYIWQF